MFMMLALICMHELLRGVQLCLFSRYNKCISCSVRSVSAVLIASTFALCCRDSSSGGAGSHCY
jgi:hypothetical protein